MAHDDDDDDDVHRVVLLQGWACLHRVMVAEWALSGFVLGSESHCLPLQLQTASSVTTVGGNWAGARIIDAEEEGHAHDGCFCFLTIIVYGTRVNGYS